MLNRRNSFILGLLLCILVVEIVILAPKETNGPRANDSEAKTEAPLDKGAAAHTMQGVSSIGSKGDKKEWELDADRALRMTENDDWIIEQVKVKFFAEGGVIYNVTGNRGDVDVKKNNIRISGNVITRSSNGYTFKTDEAFYDSANRRLTSPHKVTMIGPEEANGSRLTLTGLDMLADMQSNEIKVERDVRARKVVKDGKLATISSHRALFSGKENVARFFGNVIIDIDTLRITGPEAQFKYDKEGRQVESMDVAGGVKVTDVDKMATSQRVGVRFADERFTFVGAPRVVQNGDELIGDEIVFLDGGRRVQVSRARAKIEPETTEKASR